MFLLFIYAGLALSISFVCSLLEATLLSARVVELAERKERGDRAAALLLDIKQNRIDDAISAILAVNTVANTIGAALAGAQAGRVFGDRAVGFVVFSITWVVLFTIGLTLGVLIFSEIVPKTVGAVHGSRLTKIVAPLIEILTRLLRHPLKATGFITRLLTRGEKPVVTRREVAAVAEMAARDGTLPQEAHDLVSSALFHYEIRVEDVMTPRTVATMLPASTTVGDFLDNENCRIFSRIPIYEGDVDSVVGLVLQRDVLAAAAQGESKSTPISKFRRPAIFLPEGQPVGRVLRRLIEDREHLALVTDEFGGISGLVSMEDLVETTLGVEILDESDRVADLRTEASKLREARLERLHDWRTLMGAEVRPPDTGKGEEEDET